MFREFTRQACELGVAGTWGVDRIRSEADEFLRRFTIEAYSEKGRDRFGHEFQQMVSNWGGTLLPEVDQQFQKSEEWHQFEEELLAVAERQARMVGMLPTPLKTMRETKDEISSKLIVICSTVSDHSVVPTLRAHVAVLNLL